MQMPCDETGRARRVDPLTPRERSRRMAAVRYKGNASTELTVARILRVSGLTGWRRHRDLLGHPDFYFTSQRVVLFVHGCFWHGCRTCARRIPTSNRSFWVEKIEANVRRDRRVARQLRRMGFSVLTIWEHEIGRLKWVHRLAKRLADR
jgi:DNA mismatch endonuclease, patch repair protein